MPAIWQQSVCFGFDDGCLYCVDLVTGQLRWKHRTVQGQTVLRNFDILAESQPPLTDVVHTFEDVAVDGKLTLTLQASTGQTVISGIEITRTSGASTGK